MSMWLRPVVRPGVVLALAGVLLLGACGGGDDDDPTADGTGTSGPTEAAGGLEIAGALDDDDLLVPRAYLQGEWCDSDGQRWSIEGDTARFEDPSSGGTGEFPVDLAFVDNPDNTLVSQSGHEFVVASGGSETTFTRGAC